MLGVPNSCTGQFKAALVLQKNAKTFHFKLPVSKALDLKMKNNSSQQNVNDTSTCNDEDQFYAAIGRTITQWANVEQSLFQVYNHIMKPQIWLVTSATYHVAQTFNNKLELVSMAVKSAYNDKSYTDTNKAWVKLKDKLRKISSKRNDIAHLIAFNDIENGLQLRPAILNAKAMLNEDYKSKIYKTKDINKLQKTFINLSHDVDEFKKSLPPPPLERR